LDPPLGAGIGKTKKGKGTKIMAIADASGLPLAIWAGPANTHECKLVEKTIDSRFVKGKPENLIGDMAYDSDPLDKKLKKRKIKLSTGLIILNLFFSCANFYE